MEEIVYGMTGLCFAGAAYFMWVGERKRKQIMGAAAELENMIEEELTELEEKDLTQLKMYKDLKQEHEYLQNLTSFELLLIPEKLYRAHKVARDYGINIK